MCSFSNSDENNDLDELHGKVQESLARRVSTSTEALRTPQRTSPQETENDVVTAVNLAKAKDTPVWLRFSLESTGESNANKAIRFGKDYNEGPNGPIYKHLEVTFSTAYEELKKIIQD
jgi:hypothetical protein